MLSVFKLKLHFGFLTQRTEFSLQSRGWHGWQQRTPSKDCPQYYVLNVLQLKSISFHQLINVDDLLEMSEMMYPKLYKKAQLLSDIINSRIELEELPLLFADLIAVLWQFDKRIEFSNDSNWIMFSS